jgi:hypothetical protein
VSSTIWQETQIAKLLIMHFPSSRLIDPDILRGVEGVSVTEGGNLKVGRTLGKVGSDGPIDHDESQLVPFH